jgi:hypothetical protein
MENSKAKIFAAALLILPLVFASPSLAVPINQPADADDDTATAPGSEEPRFANVIEDLPLMPGLQLVEDEDVLFSEPGAGRIAETNAIGPVTVTDVYKFYRRSLPHLGWKAIDTRTYERSGERLRIDAQTNEQVTTVRFTVKPAG